jgi:hypothetical protein
MTASANSRDRLAPRTSSLECVPNMRNSFKTTFNGIPERLDYRRPIELLTPCQHHRRPSQPQIASAQSPNTIQYP